MSNFIDETERHAELYNAYTPRQRLILEIIEKSRQKFTDDDVVYERLDAIGASESEIHWLKRTGHFFPIFESEVI
ncbi:MAG: hypothetical protein L0Z68_06955 [Gammaproteobacteria bacterium]|nr:hypothetical protein [Gammaproteobacteria bacterium]